MTSRSKILPYALLGVLIVTAGFHVWTYRDFPIVRNSLIYAQISGRLLDADWRFSSDTDAYNKPLGFTVVSLPFVHTWDANVGLKMSSWLWTSLWAVSIVALFARLRERLGLGQQHLWLVLLLTLFGPLVFYQFISAYPDTLFALTFIWSLYFLDRTLSPASRWFDGVLFALTVLVSIWVKHNGLIMIPILIAFLLIRRRHLPALWRERRSALVAAAVAISILTLTLIAARQGYIPLFNLGTVEQNYTQSWKAGPVINGGFFDSTLGPNLKVLAFYCLVTLGICSPLLCLFPHFRKNLEWYVTAAIVIVSILVYKGSTFNPRYLITIAPLLAIFATAALVALPRRFRFAIIGLFVAVNAYTTLYYNSIGFHDLARQFVSLPRQDNLRLTGLQRDTRAAIDQVNKLAEGGAKTLIVVSDYYGGAAHHVLDDLFDARLRIQYQNTWNPAALIGAGPEPAVVLYNSPGDSITSTTTELNHLGKRVADMIWIVRTGPNAAMAGR